MSKQGVARLVDHIVVNNLRPAVELAIVKGAIKKHESVFKSFRGQDLGRLSVDLQSMGKLITDLKAKVSKTDDEVNAFKVSTIAFKSKLAKQNEEIIQKDQDIVLIIGTLQSV